MEWGNFTYYELISLVFSALAVVATLYIGRHTVKKQRQYAREQAYITSYCEFPVLIIEHSYRYLYLLIRLKDTQLDLAVKKQFNADIQDKEQKINDILIKLRSSGSPVAADMSDLMMKLKFDFAIKTDKNSASRLLAIAYILSAQMRSEIISYPVSAVKKVERKKFEDTFVSKKEIICSIIELCEEHKFSRGLAKR
jgi:hypothetical protein